MFSLIVSICRWLFGDCASHTHHLIANCIQFFWIQIDRNIVYIEIFIVSIEFSIDPIKLSILPIENSIDLIEISIVYISIEI